MTKPPIGVRTITGTAPTITFPLLLAGSVGALLIYSAIKNKTPVQVVKEAIGNQKPAKEPTAYTGAQWGPYTNAGAGGLQPNTFPQYGPGLPQAPQYDENGNIVSSPSAGQAPQYDANGNILP